MEDGLRKNQLKLDGVERDEMFQARRNHVNWLVLERNRPVANGRSGRNHLNHGAKMDAKLYEGSTASIRGNADLGHVPPLDITSLTSEYFKIFPQSNIKDGNVPIQFAIGSSSSHVLDLENSFLYLRCKILKSDGTKITATDTVAPTHDFFGSLFSGVEITINGYPVSSSGNHYSYRHHLFNLLTHGTGYKSTILSEELYYPDSKPNVFRAADNDGYKKRQSMAALSAEFECIGNINEAVFRQQRYLPGSANLVVTLRRNDPAFCLVAPDSTKAYKVDFSEAIFYIKRHILSPEVQNYHKKILETSKRFLYPMRQAITRAFVIAKGSQTHLSEVIFRSKLPEFCILTFVKTDAYLGSYTESPFHMTDFNVQSIQFSLDGDKTVYSNLDFNSNENLTLMGYHTLHSALQNSSSDHGISRSDYTNGSFAVCIPLMPNNHANRFQLERVGQLSVELKFHKALTDSVTCIVMGVFSTKLEIDSFGVINYDQP
jgi:hypothetical protein